MKKIFFFFLLLGISVINAQYTLRLVVTNVATKSNDAIYVAGNFNNWNPKDEKYKLKDFGANVKAVVIKDVAAGNYAFKFTRGSFDKVECAADGKDIDDRLIEVTEDISKECKIEGWKDDYPQKPKRYTASPNVKIVDTAFYIPQLQRTRRVWVYLPKSYASSSVNYPVLYMNDGQNLFNEQTAAFGEWGVDECLDTLQKNIGKDCIVIGIDNGGNKRMTEYNPYDNNQFGKGEGKQYVDFIVKNLKPFIDSKFRTKKSAAYTFIAGSSMGALISLYAVIQYPDVFGGAGIFSPAFWIVPQLFIDVEKFTTTESAASPAFYFYAGGYESATMVSDMNKMADIIQHKANYKMRRVINPLGKHNEKYWREEFPSFYTWLMSVMP